MQQRFWNTCEMNNDKNARENDGFKVQLFDVISNPGRFSFVLQLVLFLAEHDYLFRSCLCRNAACGHAVKDEK